MFVRLQSVVALCVPKTFIVCNLIVFVSGKQFALDVNTDKCVIQNKMCNKSYT